jgi:hypothetical protein
MSADLVAVLGLLVTSLGFSLVIVQLYLEFRWRRRQYAVQMVAEWNEQTGPYRRGIDDCLPGLLDVSGPRRHVQLTDADAELVYSANPTDDPQRFKLKQDIIELLNYCEYVAVSASNAVADKAIVYRSFLLTLRVWHDELLPYIRVTEKHRGYNPWEPFNNFIANDAHQYASPGRPGQSIPPIPGSPLGP